MAGISLQIDDLLGRKKRQRRETEAALLAQNLLEKGADSDAVNAITSHYLKTGEFQAPEFQTKNLPPTNLFPDGIPTRQPFSMAPKKKGLYTMDSRSGKLTQIETPDDQKDYEVKTYNDDQGHAWKIDRATGSRQDMGPNGKSYDTYVYWNSKTGEGGSGDDPEGKLADDTIKKYQDLQKRGEPISDEFKESARSAFKYRGIPFEEEELDPTLMDRARNKVSTVTKGAIKPAEKRFGEPIANFDRSAEAAYQRDLEQARRAIALNKVSKEEALKRLQAKYGKRAKGL